MNNYRINKNYAKALFMLAAERGQVDRVADDMRLVGSVCDGSRELNVVFANPTVRFDKKTAIVEQLFAERVSAETMAFLRFVVRKNRTVNLRGISEAYMTLYREDKGVVLSDLVTHQPIDDSARRMVTQMVEEYTGKTVELREGTDSNMLGGFKLEFDNKMYDARLRTKIRKLRQEFAKNDYESKL
ncbi:MAG: ATP synthase F1 subunit delta [Bacteroidales bacterium]|nr:ATP synthase F1 subunit delta [Bacteroidales bacterium]MBR5093380.1 ATP synthase F1 subunit delta [Bacteroidales bacterium]